MRATDYFARTGTISDAVLPSLACRGLVRSQLRAPMMSSPSVL
jgi:hypothetical protein